MLDQIPASSLRVDLHDISSSSRRLSSPMVVGLHGGGVMLSSRHQSDRTNPRSLFPDEEHSYEPRRHVRFAALSRNALPYTEPTRPQRRRPRNSPPKRNKVLPPVHQQDSLQFPISPTVQIVRKKHGHKKSPNKTDEKSVKNQQIGNLAREDEDDRVARELWGFPVKYSPQKQLETRWRTTNEQSQRALRAKQEEATQNQDIATRPHQESKKNEADYAQYLYLASLYGPLDVLLYCCCQPGSHGRVYMLLVDVCARRIQRWTTQRVAALRSYWIGYLAREITTVCITEGFETTGIVQERQASALFIRLKLLRAARAFRAWSDYSSRMIQLRAKMRLALTKALESRFYQSRFYQWRENVETRNKFKAQLKHFAKRKAMQDAFEQWQCWHSQHEKLHCHLVQRRLQTKRECWKLWCRFMSCNCSARILQRSWRLYSWLKQRDPSVRKIQRVFRGWRGRHRVKQLRDKMDIHRVLLRVTNVATWELRCAILTNQRRLLLEHDLIRARQQAEYVVQAEKQAEILVEPELSKVVRNSMHRKLDNHIQLLKENDTAIPTQLVKTSRYHRREAVQKVIDEERALARREAIKAFRSTCDQHRNENANPCIICQAYADFRTHENMDDFGQSDCHTCLCECIIGTGDALAEFETWRNTAQIELINLERCEQEYTVALFTSEPSIASLWKSISKERKIGNCNKLQ